MKLTFGILETNPRCLAKKLEELKTPSKNKKISRQQYKETDTSIKCHPKFSSIKLLLV